MHMNATLYYTYWCPNSTCIFSGKGIMVDIATEQLIVLHVCFHGNDYICRCMTATDRGLVREWMFFSD